MLKTKGKQSLNVFIVIFKDIQMSMKHFIFNYSGKSQLDIYVVLEVNDLKIREYSNQHSAMILTSPWPSLMSQTAMYCYFFLVHFRLVSNYLLHCAYHIISIDLLLENYTASFMS